MAGWPDDCEGVLKVKFISAHLKLKLGLNLATSYMFKMSLATSYIFKMSLATSYIFKMSLVTSYIKNERSYFVVVDYFCNFTSGRKVGLVGNSHFNPARAGVWAELGNYIDQ